MRLKEFVLFSKQEGFTPSFYRIYHEFSCKSGLKSRLKPIIYPEDYPEIDISFTAWQRERKKFFVLPREELESALHSLLSSKAVRRIIEEANQVFQGNIICFSRSKWKFGNPPDWHLNPMRGKRWPSDVHYSQVLTWGDEIGDVKFTWELNRFPYIFYLVRAYYLTGDPRYVEIFTDHLKSWEEENPFRAGVNWASSQEVAIRALTWIYALYAFYSDEAFNDEDFKRILRLLYLHGLHIEENLNFSKFLVPNNHLIGEALGLYAIGSLFPWFERAAKWCEKGRRLLVGKCLKQFHPDGGYCQASHNYHRLALHYYIWALRIAECLNGPFPRKVYDVLAQSLDYLFSFMNKRDGRLPNWGGNDGALLNPWAECDYSDFRPLIQSLSYLTRRERAFEAGPWDEELLWVFGPKALLVPVKPLNQTSRSFPVAGLHVLRGGGTDFAVLRCGNVLFRSGHADQLHLDLWWKGLNIAIDGGSYLYNDELEYHRYFMSTSSHNTVIVDGKDQMQLVRRFTWVNWSRAKLVEFTPGMAIEGEHYSYRKLKGDIIHRRKIIMQGRGHYIVHDSLIQRKVAPHVYTLHWLLGDFEYEIRERDSEIRIILKTPKGAYVVKIRVSKENKPIKGDLSIKKAESGAHPDGWCSRYYSEKFPALSLRLNIESNSGVEFTTEFKELELAKGS